VSENDTTIVIKHVGKKVVNVYLYSAIRSNCYLCSQRVIACFSLSTKKSSRFLHIYYGVNIRRRTCKHIFGLRQIISLGNINQFSPRVSKSQIANTFRFIILLFYCPFVVSYFMRPTPNPPLESRISGRSGPLDHHQHSNSNIPRLVILHRPVITYRDTIEIGTDLSDKPNTLPPTTVAVLLSSTIECERFRL